jgi:hypothetical protein
MHEFGPFNTDNMGHVRKVGQVILALTLQMIGLHRNRFDQEDPGAPGRLASVIHSRRPPSNRTAPMWPSTLQPFMHDTQAHPEVLVSDQSRVGPSPTSDDPHTLVEPVSGLTVSETSRPTTTEQPQRSPQPPQSTRRSSRIPRPILSPSTDNGSEQREQKRR